MKTKLLRVDSSFVIEGRGVVVEPGIPVDSYRGASSRVVSVRRPDGHEQNVSATFAIPRLSHPPPTLYYLCLLVGLTKDDIPVGTEIWIDDEAT